MVFVDIVLVERFWDVSGIWLMVVVESRPGKGMVSRCGGIGREEEQRKEEEKNNGENIRAQFISFMASAR